MILVLIYQTVAFSKVLPEQILQGLCLILMKVSRTFMTLSRKFKTTSNSRKFAKSCAQFPEISENIIAEIIHFQG